MNHLTEEQLILHYYGEEAAESATAGHLEDCASCRAAYAALQRVLNVMDTLPVPERGPEYEAELWGRIAPRMGARPPQRLFPAWRWAAAAGFAALVIVAFLAGRFYQPQKPAPMAEGHRNRAIDSQTSERILLAAVSNYLERSERMLIELGNASSNQTLDISSEQERAEELITESRLYRQTAARTGDSAVIGVLEELDPVLLEIAHGPSLLSPREIEGLRQRLATEGILFKIRILGSNVRNRRDGLAREKL